MSDWEIIRLNILAVILLAMIFGLFAEEGGRFEVFIGTLSFFGGISIAFWFIVGAVMVGTR